MSWFSGAAIYFVIWWVTLFIVLPHGNRSQAENGEVIQGTDPGAPTHSHIGHKLVLNTIMAGFLFGIYWGLTSWLGWDFSDIPSVFPEHLKPKG